MTITFRGFDIFVPISTHTPLAGRDERAASMKAAHLPFLLTRPLRDVTYSSSLRTCQLQISTHTPLAGRDELLPEAEQRNDDFYSHAPCGT